jgi:uncharacterized protein YndB with AHSA1/START domain
VITRHIVLPVEPDELWSALTDPDRVGSWFGGEVDWELAPGGRAHFVDDDGRERFGVVREVRPGRRLCWTWWPAERDDRDAAAVANPDEPPASEVTYVLEEVSEGTRLTVTEQQTPAPATTATVASLARAGARSGTRDGAGMTWNCWDSRFTGLWVSTADRCPATALA